MRLDQTVKFWATPAAQDYKNLSLPQSQAKRDTLPGNVKRWNTPRASDYKHTKMSDSEKQRDSLPGDLIRQEETGYANPDWWLVMMGFPSDWLDIDDQP